MRLPTCNALVWPVISQESQKLLQGQGARIEVALHNITTQVPQRGQHLLVFHAFSQGTEPEAAGELDDSAHNRNIADKRFVNLQLIDRKFLR